MEQSDAKVDRSPRWRVVIAVFLLHALAVVGLIRAFTPQIVTSVERTVISAFSVTAPVSTPPSRSVPTPSAAPFDHTGAAGAEGKKARPKAKTVPPAKIAVRTVEAPPVAGTGQDNAAGGATHGAGTGASGAGLGTGAGAGGSGNGGGGAATVKIAGDINSAKDYPRASRDLRIGASVMIDITVGTDGRPTACRVVQPSPDPDADRITCDLAVRRFRFRPARDALGNAMQATFRWRQRWFY